MSITDPIADMLTVIRNANMIKASECNVPSSKMKKGVLEVLKTQGYIADFQCVEDAKKFPRLVISLKYDEEGAKVIREIKRVSRPGRRLYRGSKELKAVYDGLGIQIISTSCGIISDKECREKNVGGEVICQIF